MAVIDYNAYPLHVEIKPQGHFLSTAQVTVPLNSLISCTSTR